jgi:hypothetical protein
VPKIPRDKLYHFGAGIFIGLIAAAIQIAAGAPFAAIAVAAFVAATVAGILKEIADRVTKKGTPDKWDAIATSIGGVVVIALVAACQQLGFFTA